MQVTTEYHLSELAVALDEVHSSRIMPQIHTSEEHAILDVGCGAGQTLIASRLPTDCRAVGVDVDDEALALGRTLTNAVEFIHAPAEELPLPDGEFDLVISRVALPYTDIPRALREIARVLKPKGRCWISLHPVSFAMDDLRESIRGRNIKGIIYRSYVLGNGLLFHIFGRVLRFPLVRSRVESVQTIGGIRRALRAAGFHDITVSRERGFIVEAWH